ATVESSRGSQRTTHLGVAHHRSARTGALAHPGLVSSAALWLRESRSPRTSRGAHRAIAHYHHPRQDELRPATPPPARHDRENSQNSSISSYSVRASSGPLLHPHSRPSIPARSVGSDDQCAATRRRTSPPIRSSRGGNRQAHPPCQLACVKLDSTTSGFETQAP